MSDSSPRSVDRPDSWKQIAAYLLRGARTVQRWEREEGLPVHRLQHDKLGSVYAYKSELDAWRENSRQQLENAPPRPLDAEASVAVLPFADMTRERDQECFCEGIAKEIIAALSRVRGMRAASRISSFRFKPGAMDACEAGRRLRVGALLEGSVRKTKNRLRISVQLTETERGFLIWAETYDRLLTDVFALQEEIAQNVVRALELTLTPHEEAELARKPTRSVEAYELYLRGRKHYYGYGPADMESAIRLFTQATALDPGFAPAWAGLADCWSYVYLYATRSDIVRSQADWASARAVELDPSSAQAHASRALAYSLTHKHAEAEREFKAAIQPDPNLFEAWYFYARHASTAGRQEEALHLYEQAMRVRPADYQSPLLAAQSCEDLGFPGEARAARERGIELAERHLEDNREDVRRSTSPPTGWLRWACANEAANGPAAPSLSALATRWCSTTPAASIRCLDVRTKRSPAWRKRCAAA